MRIAATCGGPSFPQVVSHGGSLLLSFTSDTSVTESGFLFGWTSTAEGETLPEGYCAWNCSATMRGDGSCDPACMNAECNWDALDNEKKGDCDVQCAPGCAMDMLGNGVCEAACSRQECNWDYRDCECANVLDECEGAATDGSELSAHYNNNEHACWLIRPAHHGKRAGGKMRASRVSTPIPLTHSLPYHYPPLPRPHTHYPTTTHHCPAHTLTIRCALLATHYLLLAIATHYSLLATCYSLLATHYWLLTTRYSLFLLLSTCVSLLANRYCYSLPTTRYCYSLLATH